MRLLGLDLATRTGWAFVDTEGALPLWMAGFMDFKSQRHEGGGMRYLRFRQWLLNVLDAQGPQAVFYEEIRRHMSTDAAHVHGGLLAVMQSVCEARRIPYAGIPVGTIKKRATGKGNAGKAQMIEAACVEWPAIEVSDDNVADALWIARCGLDQLEAGEA